MIRLVPAADREILSYEGIYSGAACAPSTAKLVIVFICAKVLPKTHFSAFACHELNSVEFWLNIGVTLVLGCGNLSVCCVLNSTHSKARKG
jgi:hypothetical protein